MSCVIGQLTRCEVTVARNTENSQTVRKQELYREEEIAEFWTGSIKICAAQGTALSLTFFYYSMLQKISDKRVKNCTGHKTRRSLKGSPLCQRALAWKCILQMNCDSFFPSFFVNEKLTPASSSVEL